MDSANERRHYIATSSLTDWACTQKGPWIDISQIAKFMWPAWDPPGCCRPQVGSTLAHDGNIGRYETKPKRKKAGTMYIFIVMHCIVNRLLIRMYCAFRPCRLPAILLTDTEVWLCGIVHVNNVDVILLNPSGTRASEMWFRHRLITPDLNPNFKSGYRNQVTRL